LLGRRVPCQKNEGAPFDGHFELVAQPAEGCEVEAKRLNITHGNGTTDGGCNFCTDLRGDIVAVSGTEKMRHIEVRFCHKCLKELIDNYEARAK